MALGDGLTVWFTGLPSAGKTTIAEGLAVRLAGEGFRVEVLDGDAVRRGLSRDLGFSRADRDEHVRRVGYIANLLSRNGVVVLCALASPYRSARDEVRAEHGTRFCEVYVATPLDVCRQRDVKGLYARQAAGALAGLTGADDPYEPPLAPELVVPAHTQSPEESVELVRSSLLSR